MHVAIASRYTQTSKIQGLNNTRLIGSIFLNKVARLLISRKLTDPMSGFFITRRSVFSEQAPYLSHNGYKILLDFVSSLTNKDAVLEFPLIFRARNSGQSKMDFRVLWELLLIFLDRIIKGFLPRRFISFSLIGLIGLLIHMCVLFPLYILFQIEFSISQIVSTELAMINNFLLNNYLTYQNSSLHGKRLIIGYIKFASICTLGGLISFIVANYLYDLGVHWTICGSVGALAAACSNYSFSQFLTWDTSLPIILRIKGCDMDRD